MSASAQYASNIRPFVGKVSVANVNRDGTGTLAHIATAGPNGARLERLHVQALSTTTAGMIRLYLTKGKAGPAIGSLTFSGTTATAITTSAHGMANGARVTVQNVYPEEYNVTEATITVVSPTSFTYVMSSIPPVNAITTGAFSWTPSNPVSYLWKEIPVTAVTPTGVVMAFNASMSAASPVDAAHLPLQLSAGYSLRASTVNAEAFDITGSLADY